MKMEKPTVEAVRFGSRDVIATSGQLNVKGVQIGGVGNDTPDDSFVSNVKGATDGTRDPETIVSYFNAASSAGYFTIDNYQSASFFLGNDSVMFWNFAYEDEYYRNDYNGWYTWDNDKFVWQSK